MIWISPFTLNGIRFALSLAWNLTRCSNLSLRLAWQSCGMIGHDPWHITVEAVLAMPHDCQAGHKGWTEQRVRFHTKDWANLVPLRI